MNDAALRHELNELTQETYGFDFEAWVTNGYDQGDYIPYSYEADGRLIANVSVNRMNFIQNGKERHYIQLGTVMTRKEFRKQGYAKRLMETVLDDYSAACDGIYLFANLDALGFYDKMGFSRALEYQYSLKNDMRIQAQEAAGRKDEAACFQPVQGLKSLHQSKYMHTVRHSAVNSALEQLNKYGLQMFYTSDLEQVYYSSQLDCYAVMRKEANTLYLQSVICTQKIRLEQVLADIREPYDNLILGFSPGAEDADFFVPRPYDGGEDYRLFVYGEKLKEMEAEKLCFPELSHA